MNFWIKWLKRLQMLFGVTKSERLVQIARDSKHDTRPATVATATEPTNQTDPAMANYNTAASRVLKHEGGYSGNKYDKGNYVCSGTGGWVSGKYPFSCSSGQPVLIGTMRGIAAPVLASYLGRVPTVQEMKNLTKETALAIYKKNYWDRMKGDLIQNQAVADILFDGCVNHGVTRGVKLMQKALNLTQDGIVGPVTLNAINTRDPRLVYERYKNERRAFYQSLVFNDPSQQVFLAGWLNRINSFKDFAPVTGLAVVLIGLLIWFN